MGSRGIFFGLLALALSGCGGVSQTAASDSTKSPLQSPPNAEQELKTLTSRAEEIEAVSRLTPSEALTWQMQDRLNAIKDYQNKVNEFIEREPSFGAQLLARLKPIEESAQKYRRALTKEPERRSAQAELVQDLNQRFGCGIQIYSSGEQQTFRHELSLAHCNPLGGGDYRKASEQLSRLAAVSREEDARALRDLASHFLSVGPGVEELQKIRDHLLGSHVLENDNGRMRVRYVGHPFENRDETKWLEAYQFASDKLAHRLNPDQEGFGGCPQPACDPQIYAIARAVTLRPPLDWIYFQEGKTVSKPSIYGLSYFQQRFASDSRTRQMLDLEGQSLAAENPDIYDSNLASDGRLVFPNVLSPSPVSVSVVGWNSRTEFPLSLPLFYLFQEAHRILTAATAINSLSEIRFEPSAPQGEPIVTVSDSDHGRVLHIRALHPSAPRDLIQVQGEISHQVAKLL